MDLYSRLSTRSKRALLKVSKRYGHPYRYKPRGPLLVRLSKETGLTKEQIYLELLKLRHERLTEMGYKNTHGVYVLE